MLCSAWAAASGQVPFPESTCTAPNSQGLHKARLNVAPSTGLLTQVGTLLAPDQQQSSARPGSATAKPLDWYM